MYWDFSPEIGKSIERTCSTFRLVLQRAQEDRLATTCFRGVGRPLAGNFMRWANMPQLMRGCGVKFRIGRAVDAFLVGLTAEDRQRNTALKLRCAVAYPYPIGWTSAMKGDARAEILIPEYGVFIRRNDLEAFSLNRRTSAMRIKAEVYDILPAPLTKLITLVILFYWDRNTRSWIGFIQTIYPGEDIGPLQTSPGSAMMEGVVFWDWNAPGDEEEDWGPNAPDLDDIHLDVEATA